MAAFTPKERDTEIPAGKAKTREHAMAGFDIAEYFQEILQEIYEERRPQDAMLKVRGIRDREDALGRRIILKPYAKDRARLLKRRPGPERPWREELGLKPAATRFSGKRRRKTAVFRACVLRKKRYNKAVAEEYRIAERLAEAMGMKLVRYSEQDSVRLFTPGHMQPVRVWNGPGAGEEALRSRNGLLNAPANAPCPLGLDENSSNEEIDLVLSAMGFQETGKKNKAKQHGLMRKGHNPDLLFAQAGLERQVCLGDGALDRRRRPVFWAETGFRLAGKKRFGSLDYGESRIGTIQERLQGGQHSRRLA